MAPTPFRKTLAKLDLLSLRLFLTICEEESIGRAAERESIAPSAVTKRIQELEHLFGVKLLYRHARGTVPTPVGQALASHARNVFLLVEDIRIDLSQFAQGMKGHVRVSAIPSAVAGFLAHDLREFLNLHPQVELDIREQLSADAVHAVATGASDLGIYATPPDLNGDVEAFPYYRDELKALVPRHHPLAGRSAIPFASLVREDLIGLQENSSVMCQLRRAAQALGRQLTLRYQVHTNEAARALADAGLGIAIMPAGLAKPLSDESYAVVPIEEDWARREMRICVRRGVPLPAQVQEMLSFLRHRRGGMN